MVTSIACCAWRLRHDVTQKICRVIYLSITFYFIPIQLLSRQVYQISTRSVALQMFVVWKRETSISPGPHMQTSDISPVNPNDSRLTSLLAYNSGCAEWAVISSPLYFGEWCTFWTYLKRDFYQTKMLLIYRKDWHSDFWKRWEEGGGGEKLK